MNDHHASIKVEATTNETETNILDIIFKGLDFRQIGTLDTRMYFKPTDSHSLLHRKSFHPPHVFSGMVKSQLLRFSRICTQDCDNARKVLFTAFRKRGYSRGFLWKITGENK